MSDTLTKETISPETMPNTGADTMMAVRNYGPRDYRLERVMNSKTKLGNE